MDPETLSISEQSIRNDQSFVTLWPTDTANAISEALCHCLVIHVFNGQTISDSCLFNSSSLLSFTSYRLGWITFFYHRVHNVWTIVTIVFLLLHTQSFLEYFYRIFICHSSSKGLFQLSHIPIKQTSNQPHQLSNMHGLPMTSEADEHDGGSILGPIDHDSYAIHKHHRKMSSTGGGRAWTEAEVSSPRSLHAHRSLY